MKIILFQQVLDACHCQTVTAGKAAKTVMRFFQAVNRNRDCCHPGLIESFRRRGRDQGGIAGHPPCIADLIGIAQDVKKVRTQQRLPARDAEHHPADIKIVPDLVENIFIFFCRPSVGAR